MSSILIGGRIRHVVRGVVVLVATSVEVLLRRALRRSVVRGWTIPFEIGTRFYRRQFDHALAMRDIVEARAYLDAVTPVVHRGWPVTIEPVALTASGATGRWMRPAPARGDGVTMLYLHGGGYAFDARVSRRFAAQLACRLRVPVFAADYRLTPEHAWPAQLQDAVAAYRHLLDSGVPAGRIVLAGDSAGGHLVLMTLVELRRRGWPLPMLAIALSPWTDTGLRGASQFGNDVHDMVQGYQTLLYSRWLKAGTGFTDEAISPIHQDFHGLPPVYLQAGGCEILVDMIRDFAEALRRQGAPVHLDVWPHMTHEFHAYDDSLEESREALRRLSDVIEWARQGRVESFPSIAQSEVAAFGGTARLEQPHPRWSDHDPGHTAGLPAQARSMIR